MRNASRGWLTSPKMVSSDVANFVTNIPQAIVNGNCKTGERGSVVSSVSVSNPAKNVISGVPMAPSCTMTDPRSQRKVTVKRRSLATKPTVARIA